MNIKTKQINNLENLPKVVDLLICASGYESRCTFVYEQVKNVSFEKKVCFKFRDNTNLISANNHNFFSNNGFDVYDIDGYKQNEISFFLNQYFQQKFNKDKSLNIIVDYSSMTRGWYAEILSFFKKLNANNQDVNLFFLYSLGTYLPPSGVEIYNSYVEPIFGYSNLSIPERPTALIIGLGYERNRAYSLKEYLDAENVNIFIAENDIEEKYQSSVYSENRLLIEQTADENIFHYPLKDMAYTEMILKQLCFSLLNNYRIVLAPSGPKPFTLLCFIVASQMEDIDVWRVSAGNDAPAVDKKPTGEILIFCVQISK